MKIEKNLNIVIPIERGDPKIERDAETGRDISLPNIEGYVYSMPLAQGAFEANYELIARTYTKIFTGGFGVVAGPRTSAMILREVGLEMGQPERATALMAEIKRLSMFAHMSQAGWQQIPIDEALGQKLMDEQEWSEVENALAFFIVTSAMSRKAEMKPLLAGMASFWGTLPTLSSFTDYLASLRTSTATATSQEKKPAGLSVPH